MPGVVTLIICWLPSRLAIDVGAVWVMVCSPAGYADTASTVGILVVEVGSETRYKVWFGENPAIEVPFTLMSFSVLSDNCATLNWIV